MTQPTCKLCRSEPRRYFFATAPGQRMETTPEGSQIVCVDCVTRNTARGATRARAFAFGCLVTFLGALTLLLLGNWDDFMTKTALILVASLAPLMALLSFVQGLKGPSRRGTLRSLVSSGDRHVALWEVLVSASGSRVRRLRRVSNATAGVMLWAVALALVVPYQCAEARSDAEEYRLWQTTRQVDTLANYRLYLERFPRGKNAAEATQHVQRLRAEAAATARWHAFQAKFLPYVLGYLQARPQESCPGGMCGGPSELAQAPLGLVVMDAKRKVLVRELYPKNLDALVPGGAYATDPDSVETVAVLDCEQVKVSLTAGGSYWVGNEVQNLPSESWRMSCDLAVFRNAPHRLLLHTAVLGPPSSGERELEGVLAGTGTAYNHDRSRRFSMVSRQLPWQDLAGALRLEL